MSTNSETPPVLAPRHRTHQSPARDRRITVRLSAEEADAIGKAAADAGLTPAGFTAKAAIAAAAQHGPLGADDQLRELAQELFAARRAANSLGINLNQAVTAYHVNGTLPRWLSDAVRVCMTAVVRIDEASTKVIQRLR